MEVRWPLPLAGQCYTLKRKSLKDEDANLHARSLRMQCLIHRKGLTSSQPAPHISTSPTGVPLSWQIGCLGDGLYCGGETPGSAQTPYAQLCAEQACDVGDLTAAECQGSSC